MYSNNIRHISRTLVLLSLGLLPVLVMGCKQEEEKPVITESSRNVRVLTLAADTMNEYFEISGPVSPVRGADISAEESGPVVKLQAVKGQNVEAGQALLEQDRKILRAEMEAAKVSLAAQEYNVDKVQQLFDAGKVSRIELLTAQTQYQSAKALADISSRRYQRALVSSPFAGVVSNRYVELGQMVMPGQPVFRVIDPYTLKLEGYLTANQIGFAKVGATAQVRLGQNEMSATGLVTWVGLEADRATGKFKVEIEISNPDMKLRSGVIGRARLAKNVTRDVVTIPRDAVVEGRHGPEAFVAVDGRAHRRTIELGPDQGSMVVVTGGLKSGDQLVVRGHRELVEGSLLDITATATARDGSVDSDPPQVRAAGNGAAQ